MYLFQKIKNENAPSFWSPQKRYLVSRIKIIYILSKRKEKTFKAFSRTAIVSHHPNMSLLEKVILVPFTDIVHSGLGKT